MFQNLEDEALCSELVSIQLPDSDTCSDKASLVGGSLWLSFLREENSSGLVK